MVSQKRAALDVIYNRISQLNSKVVIVHDAEKDKSRKIDRDIAELETLAQVLQKKRPFGLSLQQMYARSKKISSREDPGYQDFRVFREKDPCQGMTYDSLVSVVKDTANEIADSYYDFRKTIDKNKLIVKLKDNLDSIDIQELLDKIEDELQEGGRNKTSSG
ncbi:MAG TPA: hypothetical protein DGK91_08180 [Clostridium sp.]|nr:hypothetical protein [Clostridium sp.]